MPVCVVYTVGVYMVMVRASNLVSNESSSVEFIVDRPVNGVSINVSTKYLQLGTEVFFQALIDTASSDVHCDWSFGDLESAIDAGNASVSVSFSWLLKLCNLL